MTRGAAWHYISKIHFFTLTSQLYFKIKLSQIKSAEVLVLESYAELSLGRSTLVVGLALDG